MEEAGCSFDVEWECRINKWLNSGFGTYNPGILNYNTLQHYHGGYDQFPYCDVAYDEKIVHKMKNFLE